MDAPHGIIELSTGVIQVTSRTRAAEYLSAIQASFEASGSSSLATQNDNLQDYDRDDPVEMTHKIGLCGILQGAQLGLEQGSISIRTNKSLSGDLVCLASNNPNLVRGTTRRYKHNAIIQHSVESIDRLRRRTRSVEPSKHTYGLPNKHFH